MAAHYLTDDDDHQDNVSTATLWERMAESTRATLDLDLSTLQHEFIEGAGY